MGARALALLRLVVIAAFAGCGTRAPAAPASGPPAAAPAQARAEAKARRAEREQPPPGYVRMVVGGVAPTRHGHAILLSNEAGTLGLPIFIGEGEALSILVRLRQHPYQRPLTHDLLDTIVRRLGGSIESVRVDDLKRSVFFATVIVRSSGRVFEVDSRASDAIALAVGNNVPIFVAKTVIERAAIDVRGLRQDRPGAEPRGAPAPETDPGHLKL